MNADRLTRSDMDSDFVDADKTEGDDFWERVDAAMEEHKYAE